MGVYKFDDVYPELDNLGWVVFDVEGDGNCGYYCLLLGLENNGNLSLSVNTMSRKPMRTNKPWQYSVMNLRSQLAKESERLINGIYNRGEGGHDAIPWFYDTTATNETEFCQLTDRFVADGLPQHDYFNGSLKDDELFLYQMNPYWTAYVFSSLFQMRIIIYTRKTLYHIEFVEETNEETDKENKEETDTDEGTNQETDVNESKGENINEEVTNQTEQGKRRIVTLNYEWTTQTMNHNLPLRDRISQEDGLKRISDMEYNRIPTIKLIYTTGYRVIFQLSSTGNV